MITRKRLIAVLCSIVAGPLTLGAIGDYQIVRTNAMAVPGLQAAETRSYQELQEVRRDLNLLLLNMYRTTAYDPTAAAVVELRLRQVEAEMAKKEVAK